MEFKSTCVPSFESVVHWVGSVFLSTSVIGFRLCMQVLWEDLKWTLVAVGVVVFIGLLVVCGPGRSAGEEYFCDEEPITMNL